MKKILLILPILLLTAQISYSQYIFETFESSWLSTPEAPFGWTQSREVLVGNGTPDGISTTTGEKDWQRNVNTGTGTWELSPSSPGIVPNSAISGTGAAWLQNKNFGSSSLNWGSRRLESPSVNLSSSAFPYISFWMFYADNSETQNLRITGSTDGGATWLNIQQVVPNFVETGTPTGSTGWSRITVAVPAAFKASGVKFGIEVTSILGDNNIFIDDFSVIEFTPNSIISTGSGGLWSSPSTWAGGIVPTANDNVTIEAGATVTIDVNTARTQLLFVKGKLQYADAASTQVLQAFGNLVLAVGAEFNSFGGSNAKKTCVGGNIINAGTIDFGMSATSTSESSLLWLGYGPYTFTNSGTIKYGKINSMWCAVTQGVTFNSDVTVSFRFVLGLGTVTPNGKLTLGLSTSNDLMLIERLKGSFAAAPIFASGVNRYVGYHDGSGVGGTSFYQIAPCNRITQTPGEEIESVSGTRTVTGGLGILTHGKLQLAYPLTLGTPSYSTSLTLLRGILQTDSINILRISSNVSIPTGTDPSTATPPTNHGSYIAGPLRIDFPNSTSARRFPVGAGTELNLSSPNANRLLYFTLNTTVSWASGTSLTVSVAPKPSGLANSPLTYVMGTRAYKITLNGGPDLPTAVYISGLRGSNYTYGDKSGSDSLKGKRENLLIAQSPSLTGPWTVRSVAVGSGAITNNSIYSQNTSASSPGPISPLNTNGSYFAWATNAVLAEISARSLAPSGKVYYHSLSTTIPMTGTIKNEGTGATLSEVNVTRKIIGTAYSSTISIPAGIEPGSIINTNFSDFTGWASNVTYQIKDSVYYPGDTDVTNDTNSVFFTPAIPKAIMINYGGDTRSRDSIVVHMANLGLGSEYDLVSSFPNFPLSAWRTIICFASSASSIGASVRDSLKLWLDGSSSSAKRSLVVFGNDLGYGMDPRSNPGAPAADTIFYRQYLRAAFLEDSWVSAFNPADSTLKGINGSPWTSITAQRINDPYPDLIQPATWNNAGGTLQSVLIPITESGNGDSCAAIAFNGTNYNTFYMSNQYYGIVPTVSGALSPQGVVLNVIKTYIENAGGIYPVELASFTSSIDKRNVTLKWSTNNEENNAGFDIEKRVSGTGEWNKAGNVAGAGNSNTIKNYTFSENNLATGRYQYRLKQIDFNGNYKYYELGNEVIIGVPVKFELSQNYPNPFNPSTKINFDLPFDSKVQIKVFDMTGREVAQIVNETKTAGYYTVQFNASAMASGVYFYQIQAAGGSQSFVKTMKMVLVK
ncbi:MAG: T9SS type A sorting domain-containing protein [Ignavibacteria bacterium]|nr:T9SS type A sorting domain-containing protein [Ignavibacteria bacterium]